jgi:hypothetical protein
MLITGDSGTARTWLLAAELKHGADKLVAGMDGERVVVDGSRIERGGHGMLETRWVGGAAERRSGGAETSPPSSVVPPIRRSAGPPRQVTIVGEIVDSKCFLGAMNPGSGATHRLCAIRCLRGDLPPLIAGRDETGAEVVALLSGPGGERADSTFLRLVSARVRVTGRLRNVGSLQLLESDPGTIQRLLR